MKKGKILTIGNWIFIPIEKDYPQVISSDYKYVACSRSFVNIGEIYTYEEIIAKWPDVQSHSYIACFQEYTNHK